MHVLYTPTRGTLISDASIHERISISDHDAGLDGHNGDE